MYEPVTCGPTSRFSAAVQRGAALRSSHGPALRPRFRGAETDEPWSAAVDESANRSASPDAEARILFTGDSLLERMTPLVSGYLQAYAMTDSTIRSTYRFERYNAVAKANRDDLVRDQLRAAADVYAFSCYVWNMGVVRFAVNAIRQARPQAQIILGGPQVMSQGQRYLSKADERTVICNGEGEITFAQYLLALTDSGSPLHEVSGLSFYRDGELVTTPKQPR
ncbi:MAG TPA: cobalamin-dependent protein, partial [Actinospica sp.]|nr:cobalamin-dependent protein [Actinospica sp.]